MASKIMCVYCEDKFNKSELAALIPEPLCVKCSLDIAELEDFEDDEDYQSSPEDFMDNDTDALGRNFSDADNGL